MVAGLVTLGRVRMVLVGLWVFGLRTGRLLVPLWGPRYIMVWTMERYLRVVCIDMCAHTAHCVSALF